MTCVHRTSDRIAAQLLRGALEAEGVPAIVQGEDLTSLEGELPAGASAEYRVAIVDDEQLPRATLVTKRWLEAQALAGGAPSRSCEVCGERHEPQFRSCWKCGADLDAA
jgi:hypothetical protein